MNRDTTRSPRPAFWLLTLAAILLAAILIAAALDQSQAAAKDSAVVTYTRGVLHIAIPYDAPRPGAGRLKIEVLDPEDRVIGHAEQQVDAVAGQGRWQEDIRLAGAPAIEDLVWYRV